MKETTGFQQPDQGVVGRPHAKPNILYVTHKPRPQDQGDGDGHPLTSNPQPGGGRHTEMVGGQRGRVPSQSLDLPPHHRLTNFWGKGRPGSSQQKASLSVEVQQCLPLLTLPILWWRVVQARNFGGNCVHPTQFTKFIAKVLDHMLKRLLPKAQWK